MGRGRLPRRRRGGRRVSSEQTTDSPPRQRTSGLPRPSVTSTDRAPGASPVSSVLAWTAPAVSFRSSARLSRSSARLPRTSAQPPTSWERPPDGLGARNESVGRWFQRRRCAFHDVGTLQEVLGAYAEDLGPSLQVRGSVSERSGRPFRGDRNDVLVPQGEVPVPRKSFPCPRKGFPRPRLSFPCSRKDAPGRRQRPTVPGGTFRAMAHRSHLYVAST
jgi:hypothetical protein